MASTVCFRDRVVRLLPGGLPFLCMVLISGCTASRDLGFPQAGDGRVRAPSPHARTHVYHFAHVMFPNLIFTDPIIAETLFEEQGADFPQRYYEYVGQQMPEESVVEDVGFEVTSREGDFGRLFTISFHEPQGHTEPYFIGVLFTDNGVQYHVLEKTFPVDGAPAGVGIHGQWLEGRARFNHGALPASKEAFEERIIEMQRGAATSVIEIKERQDPL